jgi:hypothetical protein
MIVQTTPPAYSSALREKRGIATNAARATHLRDATHHSIGAAGSCCEAAFGKVADTMSEARSHVSPIDISPPNVGVECGRKIINTVRSPTMPCGAVRANPHPPAAGVA